MSPKSFEACEISAPFLVNFDCCEILPELIGKCVRILIIAFDADKERNLAVFKSQTNLIEALWKEGRTVAVANWDMSQGKGLDDLLIGGNRPFYELMERMAGF